MNIQNTANFNQEINKEKSNQTLNYKKVVNLLCAAGVIFVHIELCMEEFNKTKKVETIFKKPTQPQRKKLTPPKKLEEIPSTSTTKNYIEKKYAVKCKEKSYSAGPTALIDTIFPKQIESNQLLYQISGPPFNILKRNATIELNKNLLNCKEKNISFFPDTIQLAYKPSQLLTLYYFSGDSLIVDPKPKDESDKKKFQDAISKSLNGTCSEKSIFKSKTDYLVCK